MKSLQLASIFFILLLLMAGCFTKDNASVKKDTGILILTLGKDTTSIQQFELNGDSFHTKVIFKPNGISIIEGKGTFFPNGELKSMISNAYKLSPSGELLLNQEAKITTTADSTFIRVKEGELSTGTKYSGACIVANDGGIISFYLFPYWGFYAPKLVNDSIVGNQFSGFTGGKRKFIIKRKAESSLLIGSTLMGYITLNLDKKDRLESIDGNGSSLNITGSVRRDMDFDSLTQAQIDRQMKYGIMAGRTTRDTVTFKREKLTVSINYSQPSVRGRTIFGSVVPWNRFWRAGANNATEIYLTSPLFFEGQKLDSGRYSIFVLPKKDPEHWTMMFNKKTGIWGTDYEPSQDALRVPMKIESLPSLTEKLVYSIMPAADGGAISIEWENTKASVEFVVKK